MNKRQFQKNNQSFSCINCHAYVPIHPTSSRDHCNNCLFGLHVDINPGDRANECKGVLKPIGIEILAGKEKIVYRCEQCQQLVKCITAPDDNREEIIKLSSKIW